MTTYTTAEEVIQKVTASLSDAEYDLMREYFYKQFFSYLEVTASTPDLGKTYKFDITVKNTDFGEPVTGQVKSVSTGNQLCYYNGDSWETVDTYQTVVDLTDSSIDKSKIIFNEALGAFHVCVDDRWMMLKDFRDIVTVSA
jgi:hypothetical protein